ncbi:MAG: hypothetical protein ACO1O1_02115 [Adhaeribacter sp.]
MVNLPKGTHEGLLACLGLPLLLFGLTYVLTGCYFETNDDQIITLMVRGLSIQPALSDLSLYFFGFSQLLVWLYATLPALPWYGLLLYSGLLAATGLAFWLLLHTFRYLKPWQRWALLIAFYICCWLEHVMWFNYLRVPLLLAGTSFLYFVRSQRPEQAFRWEPALLSGLLFVAAWCIRPSAALLGLLVVAPAALLLGSGSRRRQGMPLLFFGILAGGLLLWGQVRQSSAARQYQQLDWWKSAVLDYGIYEPRLSTAADSLAYAAIGHWLLADSQVIHEDFFRRHGRIYAGFIARQAPQKLRVMGEALGRDQFMLLLLASGLLAWQGRAGQPARRFLLAYGAYFVLLLLGLGLLLKLPPRVLSSCLSLFVLVLLLCFSRPTSLPSRKACLLAAGVLALAGLAYLAKVSHRAQFQRQRQAANEQVLGEVARLSWGRTLVYSALPDYFRSLSPFRNYELGAARLIPLTGWSTPDPAYRRYYRQQTGQQSFAAAVQALAQREGVLWLMEPEFALFLARYLQQLHGRPLSLVKKESPLDRFGLGLYEPAPK